MADLTETAMGRIRRYYNVPAKRGMRITHEGVLMVIVGTQRGHMRLRARRVSDGLLCTLHPTNEISYSAGDGEQG